MKSRLTPEEEVNLRLKCLELTEGTNYKSTKDRIRIADAYYKFIIGVLVIPEQTEDKETE